MIVDLRRTGAISAALHVALLLALLVTLKPMVQPTPEDQAVTMEFATEPGEVQRAQKPATMPSPSPADVPTADLPSVEPPKPTPTEAPAPPPPPPLPPPPAPQALPVPAPPIPPPPAPTPAPSAPVTVAPAPILAPETPLPVPPVPPPPAPVPTPTPTKPTPQAAPAATKPDVRPPAARPAPERPTPTQRTTSTTSQQNPTKNTADDSKTLDATLERLRSLQRQNTAPSRPANPTRGGAPGGGSPNGVDNAKLSGSERGAIGDRIRECWTRDAGARDADKMSAVLMVTTDAGGTVRDVKIVTPGQGAGGMAFAERARRAALDAQCNPIPLPKTLLGQTHTFEINFRP